MSVLTMPKFTSQILLLFSKVLHILENLLLKNFTGLKVSMSCFSKPVSYTHLTLPTNREV